MKKSSPIVAEYKPPPALPASDVLTAAEAYRQACISLEPKDPIHRTKHQMRLRAQLFAALSKLND